MSSSPSKNECAICNKTFSRPYCLTRHMTSIHPVVQPLRANTNVATHLCTMCNCTFSHNWCLTRHKSSCNGKKKPFECKKCSKTFGYERSLVRHCKTCAEPEPEPAIITFGCASFTRDHLTTEDFTKLMSLALRKSESRVVVEYCRMIISRPENMCVKKQISRWIIHKPILVVINGKYIMIASYIHNLQPI